MATPLNRQAIALLRGKRGDGVLGRNCGAKWEGGGGEEEDEEWVRLRNPRCGDGGGRSNGAGSIQEIHTDEARRGDTSAAAPAVIRPCQEEWRLEKRRGARTSAEKDDVESRLRVLRRALRSSATKAISYCRRAG
ncbi:hypothetical protein HPP92_029106 [Vanilla planifolia]|uniref:Uncharacterized protein n=1 Tax=Vanilla planifolia TaxID=51239 RepID=A0A835P4W7_VANPL|nr:hypothetical protein HPP92_029106 [Vanilla planifolia]KAG0445908.1 hypothetical protein HPP92_029095 [Vanilla planifolia]